MTGSGTNTYLVGDEDLVAIDPGPDDPTHLATLLDLVGDRLRYVLVSHHHTDHAPAGRLLADAAGVPFLAYGYVPDVTPDGALRDGDVIAVPGFSITAVYTPGHASDHLCFLADRDGPGDLERICFSGDHIMGGSSVSIAPPDGSMAAYMESLRRLMVLERPITSIAPGHGEATDEAARILRGYLENRLTREQLVLDALSDVPKTPAEIVPAAYRGLDQRLVRAAASTVWAHLRKLADEGLATSDAPDDRDGRWLRVSGVAG